jgi:hypothetical protein
MYNIFYERNKNQLVQLEALILDKESDLNSKRLVMRDRVVAVDRAYCGNKNWRDKQSVEKQIIAIGKEIEQYEKELALLRERKSAIVKEISEDSIEKIILLEQEDLLIAQQEEKRMSEMESTSFLDLSD